MENRLLVARARDWKGEQERFVIIKGQHDEPL